ncbi:multicopper oxidase domain-containing protein [Micromonospora chersina]|uniref:multicopper oxidase domain-containing protein n=1 Tax=Micromonospora chersina TaxID=47854 RepID=UPI0033E8DD2C
MNPGPARAVPRGSAPPSAGGTPTGRAGWHRRVAALPLGYLAGLVVLGLAHPFLPAWRWTAIHLLLLGAVSNAVLVWSAHFAAAVLRTPAPARRRADAARLGILNAGVLAVLAGGTADRPWLGVGGAALVFAAVAAHLAGLARRLRRALPARFTVTVHYYLAAAVALLAGVPVGAWMLVVDDALRPRLLLFHAHVNVLGWVTLTVLGTLLTLWPTVLRARMADGAVRAATVALPPAVAGLVLLGAGVLAWWRFVAAAGLLLFAVAALLALRPALAVARRRPPDTFAGWSLAAASGWLLVALAVDAVTLLSAAGPDAAADRFDAVLLPLLVGFVAQVLVGSLSHLLPMALGGGPGPVRRRTALLQRHGAQRVVTANAALAVFVLPGPPFVRITTSLLILAALVQFLVPAARVLLSARSRSRGRAAHAKVADPRPLREDAGARPLGGVAAGLALVLVAVVAGVAAQRVSDGAPVPAAATGVAPTGHTTTVAVVADGMRFHPDRIDVPPGDRLVIELTNRDHRRHDLVLDSGAKTARVATGGSARLDAGVIGAVVQGWCSLPGHRQAGMTLRIVPTGPVSAEPPAGTAAPHLDAMADPGPAFTARDAAAPAVPPGRLHRRELHVQEVQREVAPGVRQRLWTFDGTVPGPVLRGRVGDTFEITLVNDGTVDHGIDFHAGAVAPDQVMRPIDPGQRLTYRFTATRAGIWMYHCSTMPMLHHIGNGMYGAVIIDPPDLPRVDREYVLVQSELYLGPDGDPGDLAKMQAERPDAVVFNGYVAQYVHRPLPARTGERVRVWLLDAGPERDSSFHVVGAQFDTVYREGRWENRPADPGGAQALQLGPAAGGFVELTFPAAGHYPFVSHVMVDAERGARGLFEVR